MHPPVRLVAIDMDGTLLPNSVLPSGAPAISRRNQQALFGAQAADIRCVRKHFNFRYLSASHFVQVFRDLYGPTHKAFAGLDAARQDALEIEFTALLERFNVGGKSSLVVPSEYLEVVIVKR